jgi:sortase A
LPLGNGLIILSLAGLLLTFYPLIRAEIGFRANRLVSTNPTVSRGYFADLLIQVEVPVAIQAPDPNFSLFIPKIGASSPVMANIDPGNQQKYDQALKIGVAHAAGTGFPGMGETIYLFAHSTDAPWNIIRYNAVFYLLRELELEDQVIVFFSGKRFNYRVFDKKIVSASETGFFSNQGEEILILQTCWPPGTTLRRLLVFARPVG